MALKEVLDSFENKIIGKYYFVDYSKTKNNGDKLLVLSRNGEFSFLKDSIHIYNTMFGIFGEEYIIVNQFILDNFHQSMENILKYLPEREGLIFKYYYGINCERKNLSEISGLLGISYAWTKELLGRVSRMCRHPKYSSFLRRYYWENELADELYNEIKLSKNYDISYDSLYDVYMPQIIRKNHITIDTSDDKYRIIIDNKIFEIFREGNKFTSEFILLKIIEALNETSIFTKYIPKPIIKFALIEGYITIEKLLENNEEFKAKYLQNRKELLAFFCDFCERYTEGYLEEACAFPISDRMQSFLEENRINKLSSLEIEIKYIDEKELLREVDEVCCICHEFKQKV